MQRRLQYAFTQEFKKYIMEVITNRLETTSDVKIDMKMSNLKLMICWWLFTTLYHLTTKSNISMETTNNSKDEEPHTKVSLNTILEVSLTRVVLLTNSNNSANMAILCDIVRQIPTSTSCNISK
jgi:hypothetical protein